MKGLDVERIRADFPILQRTLRGKTPVYLDKWLDGPSLVVALGTIADKNEWEPVWPRVEPHGLEQR